MIWIVESATQDAETYSYGGYGVFVDREGKRIKQFTLAPDRDDGERWLKMVRVMFAAKDGKGNEVTEEEDRVIFAHYTTLEGRPENAVALVVQIFLANREKQNRVEFTLTLPPTKPKNGSSR